MCLNCTHMCRADRRQSSGRGSPVWNPRLSHFECVNFNLPVTRTVALHPRRRPFGQSAGRQSQSPQSDPQALSTSQCVKRLNSFSGQWAHFTFLSSPVTGLEEKPHNNIHRGRKKALFKPCQERPWNKNWCVCRRRKTKKRREWGGMESVVDEWLREQNVKREKPARVEDTALWPSQWTRWASDWRAQWVSEWVSEWETESYVQVRLMSTNRCCSEAACGDWVVLLFAMLLFFRLKPGVGCKEKGREKWKGRWAFVCVCVHLRVSEVEKSGRVLVWLNDGSPQTDSLISAPFLCKCVCVCGTCMCVHDRKTTI